MRGWVETQLAILLGITWGIQQFLGCNGLESWSHIYNDAGTKGSGEVLRHGGEAT